MMIMKNDNNKRRVKKPLLPTSHITHYVSPNSNHPQGSSTSQALHPCLYLLPVTARDKSKCQNAGRRRLHLHSIYEWPESWAGGQIPCNCPLFLRSILRAGFRQNCSRKTSCAPIISDACTTFSVQPAARLQYAAWVPSTPVASGNLRELK